MLVLSRSHQTAVAVYLEAECRTPLAVLTVLRPFTDRSKVKILLQAESSTNIWRRELGEPEGKAVIEVLVTTVDQSRCRLGFKADPAIVVRRWETLTAQEQAAFARLAGLGKLVISRRQTESLFLSDPLIPN